MKPIYSGIIIVRKAFAYGRRRKSLFILAHIGANDGLSIVFLLDGTQTLVIGGVGEELGTLIRLLDILRHALRPAEALLEEEKEKEKEEEEEKKKKKKKKKEEEEEEEKKESEV